jgi:hypothetical protein
MFALFVMILCIFVLGIGILVFILLDWKAAKAHQAWLDQYGRPKNLWDKQN